MNVEVILHDSGDLLPILLDDEGMPLPLPNEFILSKRHSSSNTLIRNLREIKLLYQWMQIHHIDLYERLIRKRPFTEAEITGSLVEFLRGITLAKIPQFLGTDGSIDHRIYLEISKHFLLYSPDRSPLDLK